MRRIPEPDVPSALLIPESLWIKVLNEYLTFGETRGSQSPCLLLGLQWHQGWKAANRLLKRATITTDHIENTTESLAKLQLPRLKEVSFIKLTDSELTAFYERSITAFYERSITLPSTVQLVTLSCNQPMQNYSFGNCVDGLTLFILKNAHVPLFQFCSNFDPFASGPSANVFNCYAQKQHLIPSIHVGHFVTLESHCPNLKTVVGPLRWVNQCPFENCPERFCWGDPGCKPCAKQVPTVVKCCQKQRIPAQMVCPRHIKQYFKQNRNGTWMCDSCMVLFP